MKKLVEYTTILRSKNAGPLYITFDLIFPDCQTMEYIADRLKAEMIALAYDVSPETVRIIRYGVVNAMKVTFPRKTISGNLDDADIYGCQQHIPLANLKI